MNEHGAIDAVVKHGCPRWLDFLMDATGGDAAQVELLQEFAGYCLYPSCSFQKFLLIHGPGMGKSTFVAVLRFICGPERCVHVTPAEMNSSPEALFKLAGARLNTLPGFCLRKRDWQVFKAVVAGDSLSARAFFIEPTCKVVFTDMQGPPATVGESIRRRMIAVRFDRRPSCPDPDLIPKLLEELTYIVMWAVLGLDRLILRGGFI